MRSVPHLALAFLFTGMLAAACASSGDPIINDGEASDSGASGSSGSSGRSSSSGGSSSGRPGRDAGGDALPDDDGGPPPGQDTCEQERDLYEACGFGEDVQCGLDGYVVNCRDNEDATDSAQRKAARAACLGNANCDPSDRQDCIYRTYNESQLDAAQDALLTHYCQTCEPADVAACRTRTLTYDASGGIGSTDSIFLAAWELAPALVDAIDAQCIPAAASGDAGTCYDRFDDCAGGIYIDALVVCAE